MAKIVVVGTSHIAQQSIADVQMAVEKYKPKFIAVELDASRLQALLHANRKDRRSNNKIGGVSFSLLRKVGIKGFLFALIGSVIQKKLGRIVGIEPGADMLAAVKLAQKNGIPLAIIDRDIHLTLRRFSQAFGWRERWRFVVDITRGIFSPQKELAKYKFAQIDLRTVPSEKLVENVITRLRKRYPSIYNVLIAERNKIMIERLRQLVKENPDATVLVVVGAGHRKEIERAFV